MLNIILHLKLYLKVLKKYFLQQGKSVIDFFNITIKDYSNAFKSSRFIINILKYLN